jgi:hypothetical protein
MLIGHGTEIQKGMTRNSNDQLRRTDVLANSLQPRRRIPPSPTECYSCYEDGINDIVNGIPLV